MLAIYIKKLLTSIDYVRSLTRILLVQPVNPSSESDFPQAFLHTAAAPVNYHLAYTQYVHYRVTCKC